MEDPSHISLGYEDVYLNNYSEVDDVDTQIVIVETDRKKANDGLSVMLKQPPRLVGEAAFNHQVQSRQRAYANKQSQHKISNHLM